MARLTPEMEKKILDLYEKHPSYKWVAEELGIDWRTVKRVVESAKKAPGETTPASRNSDVSPAVAAVSAAESQKDISSTAEQVNSRQVPRPVFEKGGSSAIATGTTHDHSEERVIADQNHKESVENNGRKKPAVPEPDETFKLMYSAFAQGKMQEEVVALYGLDPDFVNEHYQKFLRMRRCNPLLLQSMILDVVDARSVPWSPLLRKYAQKFDDQGYLTNKDVTDLIRVALDDGKIESVERLLNDPKETPPAGWRKFSCRICRKGYSITKHYSDDGRRLETGTTRQDGLCYECATKVPQRGRFW